MTVGDPRGIGPEIVFKALADSQVGERCDIVVIGPTGTIAQPQKLVGDWRSTSHAPTAGRLSGLAIERAVPMAQAGEVEGIVTAPIDKAALLAGGYDFPGHTEMLAALTGSKVAMMLASERLRVVLATTHIARRDVPAAVTREAIVATGETTRRGLREWFGIA